MTKKENDAATVLTQMSQLVCSSSFDFSSLGLTSPEHDSILDGNAIGATCTLEPSSFKNDLFSSLSCDSSFDGGKAMTSDPYIGFDDAEHPYAVSVTSSLSFTKNKTNENNPVSRTSFPTSLSPLCCTICNKVFKTRQALTTHMDFHKNKKLHTCSTCVKGFTTKSDLKRHYKVHDKNKSPYTCQICSSSFRDKATQTRHMKKHQPEALFRCQICEKQFNRTDSYKEHLNIHLGTKRFQCHLCGSEFNYKSSFNRHIASHKNKNDCEICGKSFQREDCLKLHQQKLHTVKDQATANIKMKRSRKKNTVNVPLKSNKESKTSVKKRTSIQYKKSKRLKSDKQITNIKTDEQNLNAIPILTSMAENVANCLLKSNCKTKHPVEDSIFDSSPILTDVSLHSPTQLKCDFMNLLNESSTEEECDSITSEDLVIIKDDVVEEGEVSPVSRVSCIVSNPLNISY